MVFQWLGLQDYQNIFDQQKQSLLWPNDREEVWGLEHPLVVTLGRRANAREEIRLTPPGATVVSTDRGGLATLHSPGQLVIYPLISLRQRQWGPREYVCHLLKITQLTLTHYGLRSSIDEAQSGLFIENQKVCFVGLRVGNGRTYHGLSLNVCNTLTFFDSIRSCGVSQRPMVSLRELGLEATAESVFWTWTEIAKKQI